MKTCKGCKYAEWDRTVIGRLHPDGRGKCKFPLPKLPVLPAAFWWSNWHTITVPHGGHIERNTELNDHCPMYAPESPK